MALPSIIMAVSGGPARVGLAHYRWARKVAFAVPHMHTTMNVESTESTGQLCGHSTHCPGPQYNFCETCNWLKMFAVQRWDEWEKLG